MAIIGIIAVSENYAIGKDGKLPWHYTEDLKFFKRRTTGHAVVMGSATWRSIGRPLPSRLNIVLSRGQIDLPPAVLLFNDKEKVVELAKYLSCHVYLIGGAKTYENLADTIDAWLVTRIPETIAGADTFIPENFLDGFVLEETTTLDGGLKVEKLRRG